MFDFANGTKLLDITLKEVITLESAIENARNAPLEATGDEEIFFYRNASFGLANFYPEDLNPTSLYVLQKNLDFQRELRDHLWSNYGFDTLQLDVVLHLRDGNGKVFGLIPPYVEIAQERVSIIPRKSDRQPLDFQFLAVPLLIDGIHRVWLARELGLPVKCITVRTLNVNNQYAKYPVSWPLVQIHTEVPKTKAYYRRQDPYTFMRPLDALRMMTSAKKEYGR